jgi:hypothetical protein
MKVTVRTFPAGKREIEIDEELSVKEVLEYAGVTVDEKSRIYIGNNEVTPDDKIFDGAIVTKVDNIKGNGRA